jgi:hypothetical protein
MSLYHFEAYACREFMTSSHNGYVLLSVVIQALLLLFFYYLCAGKDVPPSSNATDEGYQWEVQTNEGWVPYWHSQAYVVQWSSLPSSAKGVCFT